MLEMAIIVPARLASTRFPRKLLHEIKGKPLILWTAERIRQQAPGLPLFFAVAEKELASVLEQKGYKAIMTDPGLPSGTDRLAEANRTVRAAAIINVQADEPLVVAGHIETLAELIEGPADMATLAVPFKKWEDFINPNRVKVVVGQHGRALYFSRAAIPFCRERNGVCDDAWLRQNACYLHLGLYAYKAEFLEQFCALPPGRLEQIEKLEQLRALENGHTIAVGLTNVETVGIDTPADAENFAKLLG